MKFWCRHGLQQFLCRLGLHRFWLVTVHLSDNRQGRYENRWQCRFCEKRAGT